MPPVAGATGCRATCRQGCLSYSGSGTTDVRSPDANTSAARLGRMPRHLPTRMCALLSCRRDQPVTSYQNRALAAQSRFLTLQPSSGFGEEKPQTEKPRALHYLIEEPPALRQARLSNTRAPSDMGWRPGRGAAASWETLAKEDVPAPDPRCPRRSPAATSRGTRRR